LPVASTPRQWDGPVIFKRRSWGQPRFDSIAPAHSALRLRINSAVARIPLQRFNGSMVRVTEG